MSLLTCWEIVPTCWGPAHVLLAFFGRVATLHVQVFLHDASNVPGPQAREARMPMICLTWHKVMLSRYSSTADTNEA